MENDPHIVILAGGRGRGMRSRRPKALQPVLFRPMIHYVLDMAAALPHRSLSMVVGSEEAEIERACRTWRELGFFRQERPLGTGDALKAAAPFLTRQKGPVLVLSGDVILLEPASLRRMLERHLQEDAACTLGTTTLAQPNGYGRIIRRLDGSVVDVREEAECGPGERAINEVNAGIYCFSAPDLFGALEQVTDANAHREYYLPDVVKVLAAQGRRTRSFSFGDPTEVLGIDDRHALWRVESILQERVNAGLLRRGVSLQDPRSTWIDPRCEIEEDSRIEAGCVLVNAVVERDVVIESGCRIVDSLIGAGTRVLQGSYIEGSFIGQECQVGPYARLRPTCRLGARCKVGNFVELKQTVMGEGSKASHLSYIGDAEVGRGVNFGCGFITCNYDGGPVKHKTIVEDDVFIGSDCQAVAPVRLGRGSYIAAGSTVSMDVPPEALAIARSRQTNKPGYARKYRKPKMPAKNGAQNGVQEDLSKI